ncbi:NAD(P)-binding protein [Agrocybe pediades]|nr:NAD(P)-binding protein [Agrocybe pediades]
MTSGSAQVKIFVAGATGYIGGSVVSRLLKHPGVSGFKITALIRSQDKADKLNTLGVDTIIGSYTDDLELLTEAASNSDVVFTIVNGDQLPPMQAILQGLKQKFEKTGKTPILIHTSGSAIITDDARGLHGEATVFSDLDVETLNALPPTAIHRKVDIPIIEADRAGYVRAYIAAPGTVFGTPTGPLADLGVQNKHSVPIYFSVLFALDRKRAWFIGKGLNTWSAVDVEENAEFYIRLFDAALKERESIGHGKEGYYFTEAMTYNFLDLSGAVADILFELGISNEKTPSALNEEELNKYLGPMWPLFGTNSVVTGDRSRALGWKPTLSKEAFIQHVKEEVKTILAEQANKAK